MIIIKWYYIENRIDEFREENMSYKFNVVKRGYDPPEVDAYIAGLHAALDSYKEKDASISNAVVNAQIVADSIIDKAKLEAENIRVNAYEQFETVKKIASKQMENLNEFCEAYENLIENQFKTGVRELTAQVSSSLKKICSFESGIQPPEKVQPQEGVEPKPTETKAEKQETEGDSYNPDTDELKEALARKVLNSQIGKG